jgi:hypothetical protein
MSCEQHVYTHCSLSCVCSVILSRVVAVSMLCCFFFSFGSHSQSSCRAYLLGTRCSRCATGTTTQPVHATAWLWVWRASSQLSVPSCAPSTKFSFRFFGHRYDGAKILLCRGGADTDLVCTALAYTVQFVLYAQHGYPLSYTCLCGEWVFFSCFLYSLLYSRPCRRGSRASCRTTRANTQRECPPTWLMVWREHRSCLCPATPCPPPLPLDSLSQVRHTQDTHVED